MELRQHAVLASCRTRWWRVDMQRVHVSRVDVSRVDVLRVDA